MERTEALRLRGHLLKIASGLEITRAGVLALVYDLEKEYHIAHAKGNGNGKSTVSSNGIEDQGGTHLEEKSDSSL